MDGWAFRPLGLDWLSCFISTLLLASLRSATDAWIFHSPIIMIIITYIYHALINALSAHMIHSNLNAIILYTRRAQSYQNNLHKVSVDVKHHVYLLTYRRTWWWRSFWYILDSPGSLKDTFQGLGNESSWVLKAPFQGLKSLWVLKKNKLFKALKVLEFLQFSKFTWARSW